jgi:hypothetical protein
MTDEHNHFHPDKEGYKEANGEWDYVSTHGLSTDGWSIVATANAMWNKRNEGVDK